MLDLEDLQKLARALSTGSRAPDAGHIAWAIRRFGARFESLDDPARDDLRRASRGLKQIVGALLEGTSGTDRLKPRELRDVTTICRRIKTILDHVTAAPGPDRLPGDMLRVDYSRVDLAAALRSACEHFADLATERDIHYEVDLPPILLCDVDLPKLELAIGTALFNAFKYAPRGGLVRCSADAYDLIGDVVVIVEDNGPSVPASHVDAIFTRSHEGERNVAVQVDGMRLSLGLAHDLIAVLGGVLDYVPTTKKRTVFEIRLPRWAPVGAVVSDIAPKPAPWLSGVASRAAGELTAEEELDSHPVADDGRSRVVVVASSRALNRAIARRLEPEYATASVFDGETAMQTVLSVRPDLVVVDLDLASGDGESLIRKVRESDELHALVMAVTRGGGEPEIQRLLDIGAHDWISKPLMLAELHARAKRLLDTKQTQDLLSDTIGQRDTDLIALAGEVADTHHNLERAYADLEAARQRAERTSQIKSNFLRIMSHELKTPVTAITLQLDVLARTGTSPQDATMDVALDRIGRSTRRLARLVDVALEWARAEDGRTELELSDCDVAALARNVASELERSTGTRKLDLVVRGDDQVVVRTDSRVLRLAIAGLVERAIMVTREGEVGIAVTAAGDRAVVRVRDSAPTMDKNQRAEAFDPLGGGTDLHGRTGAGSGLGVYAVRTIVRALGGEIRWESGGSTGNVFAMEVPARSEPSGGTAAASPAVG